MSTYETIRAAIIDRKQIRATYGGHHRELCPHAIGTKSGRTKALFYQFGGSSSRGLSPDPRERWRCFFVDDLAGIEVLDGDWHTADNHSMRQTCIDEVDVEVDH